MEAASWQAHDRLMETVDDTIPPSDSPPPYKEPGNRLTRSTDDKVVAGLAGGLGRYFGLDPVVFRIAFVVLTLAGGSGILLYLLGWVMIPDDAGGSALARYGQERNQKLIAAVLAGVGLLLLVDEVTGGHDDVPVALVLIGLGALFLWSRRSGPPPSPPSRPPGDTGGAGAGPDTSVTNAPPAPAAPPEAPEAPKERSALVPVTLSLLAVLAGGLGLLGVSVTTGLALALLLTGGALILGAWRGRARWLIPVGLALSVALATVSVIDVPIRGGAGEVSYHPATLAEIRSPYRLAAGEMILDLRDLDLGGETLTIVASVAAGSLRIVVPAGVAVDIDAHVGAGELNVLGRLSDGLDVDRTVIESGREGAGRLVLRADVGVGEVGVRRAFP
jgi:phage shock protein PspC (stress-responsive transcriptional regulator)